MIQPRLPAFSGLHTCRLSGSPLREQLHPRQRRSRRRPRFRGRPAAPLMGPPQRLLSAQAALPVYAAVRPPLRHPPPCRQRKIQGHRLAARTSTVAFPGGRGPPDSRRARRRRLCRSLTLPRRAGLRRSRHAARGCRAWRSRRTVPKRAAAAAAAVAAGDRVHGMYACWLGCCRRRRASRCWSCL